MILDFSNSDFDYQKISPKNRFEESILDFLNQWFNHSETIEVQTSGSTGIPKKFFLEKSNMIKSAKMTGKYLHLEKGNSALLVLPVSYIAGKMMLVRAIILQLQLICLEPISAIKWEEIQKLDSGLTSIDFVALTPMQVENSLGFIDYCSKIIIGGAPLSDKVKFDLRLTSNQIFETYAMTETITHIAFKKVKNLKFTEVNNAFEVFDEVQISQDNRQCLVIKTPYQEDLLVTNDVVELIDNKNFKWIGRADNVINSGGIKLFPEQIEEKLKNVISDNFYLTSKKDETLGEKLVLVIESQEKKIDLSELNLSKYEIPKEILFENQFDRTESGKIKRKKF